MEIFQEVVPGTKRLTLPATPSFLQICQLTPPCSSSLDTQRLRELRNKCLTSSLSSLPAWMGNLGHPGRLMPFGSPCLPTFLLNFSPSFPLEPQEGIIFADYKFGPILLSTHDTRFACLSFPTQPLSAVGLDMGSTPWTG